ncbi:hypothetical protein VKT23_008683 [Stygiomarasmius scandens]|uniref:Uncharacterized protein n=1 Tax=Marasmiellus scandens TaxID=2682957 RepID=A0ABR1JH52_9AGAR
MSSSYLFPHASRFSIKDSSVTSVAGNQTINIFNGASDSPEPGSHRVHNNPLLNEHLYIPLGKLRLLTEISRETVDEQQKVYGLGLRPRMGFLRFTRTTSHARVFGVEGISSCIAIQYGGKDGDNAWERDVGHFSRNQ